MVTLRLSLIIGAVLAPALDADAQQTADESQLGAIELYESDSFDLNRSTGTMTFNGFRMFGENWSLTADEASASADELDFESGQWRFDGNISLRLNTASLNADSALFVFENMQLTAAELRGNPATFEDEGTQDAETGEQRDSVSGSAMTLRYDDAAGTFELLGSVSLKVGPYLTTGCDLVYYLGEEEFTTGSTQCAEPFRTTIALEESADSTAE